MLEKIEKKLRNLEFKMLIHWLKHMPSAKQSIALQFYESLYNRTNTIFENKEGIHRILNLEAYNFATWCQQSKIRTTRKDYENFIKLSNHFFKMQRFDPSTILKCDKEQEFQIADSVPSFHGGKIYIKPKMLKNGQKYTVVSNSKKPVELDNKVVNYYVNSQGTVSFVSTYDTSKNRVDLDNQAVVYLHSIFKQGPENKTKLFVKTSNLEKLKVLGKFIEIPETEFKEYEAEKTRN